MGARIILHPASGPQQPPVREPDDPAPAEPDEDENEPTPEPSALEIETRELLIMIKREIGVRWMTFELRCQIEKVELLLLEQSDLAPAF